MTILMYLRKFAVKRVGEVRWSDIEKDMKHLEVSAGINGFNEGCSEKKAKYMGMTIKDVLRYYWNNPKMGQSPYKLFEKALMPSGYDENGNIIYKYNEDITFEKCSHSCSSCCGCGYKWIDQEQGGGNDRKSKSKTSR